VEVKLPEANRLKAVLVGKLIPWNWVFCFTAARLLVCWRRFERGKLCILTFLIEEDILCILGYIILTTSIIGFPVMNILDAE